MWKKGEEVQGATEKREKTSAGYLKITSGFIIRISSYCILFPYCKPPIWCLVRVAMKCVSKFAKCSRRSGPLIWNLVPCIGVNQVRKTWLTFSCIYKHSLLIEFVIYSFKCAIGVFILMNVGCIFELAVTSLVDLSFWSFWKALYFFQSNVDILSL